MPDDLYQRDALLWSERQAELLRRVAAGERVNAQVDWSNVVDEILDVGLSELHGCESLLEQAIVHLLKLQADRDAPPRNHWRAEVIAFLAGARRRYSPSMAQRIDVQAIYRIAVKQDATALADMPTPPRWPALCPFELAMLTGADPDLDQLIRLAEA